MRKFTKEIAALLATAAVSASAGAATASSAEEVTRTEGVAINPDYIEDSYEITPTEGTYVETTTTTHSFDTRLMGTYVETTTTTTAVEETPTEGTYVDRFTTVVGTSEATPLIGDTIETTAYEDDETYLQGEAIETTTTTTDKWGGTSMIGTQVETTTTTTTDDTWFAGGIMDIHSGNGDANLDGKLSVADSVTILQYIGNNDKYAISEEQRESADCYNPGDGLTAMDALTIQQVDAGVLSQDDLPVYPQSDN